MTHSPSNDERIVIVAPLGQDSVLANKVLKHAGLDTYVCNGIADFSETVKQGAGAVLLTQEALYPAKTVDMLFEVLEQEPTWSSLPLVVLASGDKMPHIDGPIFRKLASRRKVTFLERPVRIVTLVSTMRVMLQVRERQYQIRDLLKELQEGVQRRDEFLAMLGHELRNPLAAVLSATDVFQKIETNDRELQKVKSILQRQTNLLSRIVNDLLDVSRVMRGKIQLKKQPTELHSVIDDALDIVEPIIAERKHNLEISLPDGKIWLNADKIRLVQIMTNLMDNAAKYTQPGGEISVSAKTSNGQMELRVRDSGIGMSREMLDSVFELFTQAEKRLDRPHGGLGIGLTLVYNLVELHGGTITANSKGLGKGSELVIQLPTLSEQEIGAIKPQVVETPEPMAEKKLKVLLVDDNEDFAEALGDLILEDGHDLRIVHDGNGALNTALKFKPDIILLDVGLPEMDGFEVARALRKKPGIKDTLLVAITGYGQYEDRTRAMEAGFDQHFVKPIKFNELRKLFSSQVSSNTNN